MTGLSLSEKSFLADLVVHDIGPSGELVAVTSTDSDAIARQAIDVGSGVIVTDPAMLSDDCSAALAIPVFRDGAIVSVVVFFGNAESESLVDPVGVFELWEPVGAYEEVALSAGYFGKMERFQNVSSFVRFEKGSGLPGQVWSTRLGLVQDDLPNHPGFLRAAGASADLLTTAMGIPIAANAYHATAVLIHSSRTPIARGFEVWKFDGDQFQLTSSAYPDLGQEYAITVGTQCDRESGILGATLRHGGALLVEDPSTLMMARDADLAMPGPSAGLSIPSFDGATLTGVSLLLF